MINPKLDEQERQLKIIDICIDILKSARNELYINMRFLDAALSSFAFVPQEETDRFAVDGNYMYYSPSYLIMLYKQSAISVNRAYMHMLLHLLFGHPWKCEGKEEPYWQIACDVTVETILDEMYKPCLHQRTSPYRRVQISKFKDSYPLLTAERVYKILIDRRPDERELGRLLNEFRIDDHSIWRDAEHQKNAQENQKRWEDIREKMETEMETFSKEQSDSAKSLLDQVKVGNRRRYDYREFLKRFSVLKEEMKVDPDSFDYIFYHYGMQLYGNVPLMEPLETKEVRKIEDFVIVVDTSMSCQGELIRKFLQETWAVLSGQESFFRKINVHIIQADEQVQTDHVITNPEEMQEYLDNMEIKGMGGTDFRPAFLYVDTLVREGAFHKLKGLIYFTDGFGIYPARMPVYDTAFVFLKEDYSDVDVPPWAIKLILEEEDLEDMEPSYHYGA